MNRKISILLLTLVTLSFITPGILAETGTKIQGAGGKYPESVVWFSEPGEILKVRQLLQERRNQEAVVLASKYVDWVEDVSGVEAMIRLYYGLNALCVSHSRTGDLDQAIVACNRAVDMYPSRWQAYNSRGTAYYLKQDYATALKDYQKAIQLLSEEEDGYQILQHNISLAEQRMGGNS